MVVVFCRARRNTVLGFVFASLCACAVRSLRRPFVGFVDHEPIAEAHLDAAVSSSGEDTFTCFFISAPRPAFALYCPLLFKTAVLFPTIAETQLDAAVFSSGELFCVFRFFKQCAASSVCALYAHPRSATAMPMRCGFSWPIPPRNMVDPPILFSSHCGRSLPAPVHYCFISTLFDRVWGNLQ